MTDTDLFTAGESTDSDQLSNPVTTDTPGVKTDAPVGSLSTMVLPELRALANRAGVKGTSGMRKNELIAAIQEIRGHSNGALADSAAAARRESGASDKSAEAAPDAPAAQKDENGSTTEAPGRERRGASREAGSARTADRAERVGSSGREGQANDRQGRQQDTKTDERGQDSGSDQGGDQQSSGGQQIPGRRRRRR